MSTTDHHHAVRRSRGLIPSAALLAIITTAGSVLSPAHALAADEPSEFSAAEMFDIPADLPGHQRGPRTPEPKPEPKPEPSTPPAAAETPREWFGHAPWWTWTRATGDWGGARTFLDEHGIIFSGSYTLDWSSVYSGGINRRASTRTLLDLNITFDLDLIAGLSGGSVFINYQSTDGRGGIKDSGDFHGPSGIQTIDNRDQISELWYQQKLWDDRVRFKIGKIDVNSEFAFPGISSGDFINSAAAYSPTNYTTMPTYPEPSTGALLFVAPLQQWYIGAGFFDGSLSAGKATGRLGPKPLFEGDEFYWIGETGVTWTAIADSGRWWGAGRVAAGAWHHTGEFARFDGGTDDNTSGAYATLEQQLLRRSDNADDDNFARGLFTFLQLGYGEEEVNPAAHHVGVGIACKGTFEGRDSDGAGIHFSWIDLSDADGASFQDDETLIELMYKFQVTPAISVRPDLQFIFNPSGAPDVDDAVVGAIRIEITF